MLVVVVLAMGGGEFMHHQIHLPSFKALNELLLSKLKNTMLTVTLTKKLLRMKYQQEGIT